MSAKISDFRIYRINESDWYMARSLAEAVGQAFLDSRTVDTLYEDDEDMRELTEKDLRRTRFGWEGPRGGRHYHSFAKELSLREPRPQIFASEEY